MTIKRFVLLTLLLAYLATGFYVVSGNQVAAVRRFGRALRNDDGSLALKPSGLFYDLPWPFSQIDRINLHETRTLAVAANEVVSPQSSSLLADLDSELQSQFLTGDRNILHVTIRVDYRVSESQVSEFLYGSESAERRLQSFAESILAELVLQSGVDFVHTFGRTQLREQLILRLRDAAREGLLGVEIDDVAIDDVAPPIRVKADFLDVLNARADRETYIHKARAYAQTRQSEAQADASKLADEASIDRDEQLADARSQADRFENIIARFERDEQLGVQRKDASRKMAMQRLYVETARDVFRRVAGKVFLDSGKEVDLTIFRDPKE